MIKKNKDAAKAVRFCSLGRILDLYRLLIRCESRLRATRPAAFSNRDCERSFPRQRKAERLRHVCMYVGRAWALYVGLSMSLKFKATCKFILAVRQQRFELFVISLLCPFIAYTLASASITNGNTNARYSQVCPKHTTLQKFEAHTLACSYRSALSGSSVVLRSKVSSMSDIQCAPLTYLPSNA